MKLGAKCRHCGGYRVFVIGPDGAVIPPDQGGAEHLCLVAPGKRCEPQPPEDPGARMVRQIGEAANRRAMGMRMRKTR